ncbi:MAG: hypothetical protein QF464_12070, partial [Myxococcota bacterium]|nr:hypothetical protein [Myxococcota bacterium]
MKRPHQARLGQRPPRLHHGGLHVIVVMRSKVSDRLLDAPVAGACGPRGALTDMPVIETDAIPLKVLIFDHEAYTRQALEFALREAER